MIFNFSPFLVPVEIPSKALSCDEKEILELTEELSRWIEYQERVNDDELHAKL